jgi:hypothetical protein
MREYEVLLDTYRLLQEYVCSASMYSYIMFNTVTCWQAINFTHFEVYLCKPVDRDRICDRKASRKRSSHFYGKSNGFTILVNIVKCTKKRQCSRCTGVSDIFLGEGTKSVTIVRIVKHNAIGHFYHRNVHVCLFPIQTRVSDRSRFVTCNTTKLAFRL